MDKRDLKDRYEATGEEAAYEEALPLYEQAIANGADPQDFIDYGYLLYYQIIGARAGLRETELPIALHEKRLAAAPDDIREYRFLASAYLAAHAYGEAAEVIERGLAVAPDDPILIGSRAEVRGETGDSEGALSDWRRALELDPDHIGPLYMSAFFLERLGRRQEAIDTWQKIIEWSESRGYELDTLWPKQELARLQSAR